MNRDLSSSERTAALYDRREYTTETKYEQAYLGSDLVQGMLGRIDEESNRATTDVADAILMTLDQAEGVVSRAAILSDFPDKRGVADRTLARLEYYCLTLEAEHNGETVVGLHPDGMQAARRGYDRDRTRRAALET